MKKPAEEIKEKMEKMSDTNFQLDLPDFKGDCLSIASSVSSNKSSKSFRSRLRERFVFSNSNSEEVSNKALEIDLENKNSKIENLEKERDSKNKEIKKLKLEKNLKIKNLEKELDLKDKEIKELELEKNDFVEARTRIGGTGIE